LTVQHMPHAHRHSWQPRAASTRLTPARPTRRLVILVTGIRKGGIGYAICKWLALLGHFVIVAQRDHEAGREAAPDIRKHTGNIGFVHAAQRSTGQVARPEAGSPSGEGTHPPGARRRLPVLPFTAPGFASARPAGPRSRRSPAPRPASPRSARRRRA